MRISDHQVFITGGGSGIGLALAGAFLVHGNRVTICGRDAQKLQAAAERYPGLETLPCDITTSAGLDLLGGALQDRLKDVSILINNAGIADAYCLVKNFAGQAALENELATNLSAPIRLSSLFLPTLLRCPEAAIVNVTSGFALWPNAATPGYSVAKSGLSAYTKVLRHQLRETGVRVFEVLPPVVDTPMVDRAKVRKLSPEKVAKIVIRQMRRGTPEVCIGDVKMMKWGRRLAPGLLDWILLRYPFNAKDVGAIYSADPGER